MTQNSSHSYEDLLMEQLRPQGVVFLWIMVLEGPDITKFIAPPSFMEQYLENQLYNHDPTLVLPQENKGFYNWTVFAMGDAIIRLMEKLFKVQKSESMVFAEGTKRLVVTTGGSKDFSLEEWDRNTSLDLEKLLG